MKIVFRPVASLSDTDRDAIWAFASRYVDTTRELFERSIRQKQQIGLAYADRRGAELVAVVTIDVAAVEVDGRKVVRIFTANTLVREDHRGRNIIQRMAVATYLRARLRHPLVRMYWFFDTYSYRSYLLLPRNFSAYWPRLGAPTPPEVLCVMDAIARPLYGDAWDAGRGVVRADSGKRLKPFVAPIDEAVSQNPHVRFFLEQNPRHADGEMLVCMAPLTLANWSSVIRHFVVRALSLRRRQVSPPG